MYRLTATTNGKEIKATFEAPTLEAVTKELFGYQPDMTACRYYHSTEEGHYVWWENEYVDETSLCAVPILDEEGDVIEYQRSRPLPYTVENVIAYAKHCLDTPHIVIEEI